MPQAMALIRAELGPDAVILSSRRVAGGVEITAALEAPDVPQPAPVPEPERRTAAEICLLARHGTPEALARKLRNGPLSFALSVVLRFQPLDAAALRKKLLFVGPP